MARTFRRQRSVQPISELNLTNLIDVAFTLLIVFMIAAPLIQQEQTIPVDLPVQSLSPQPRTDPNQRFEYITVQPNGRVLLGDRPMTIPLLSAELARFAAEPQPPIMRLRFDANAKAQDWVTVMDELQRHNLAKISVDTKTVR